MSIGFESSTAEARPTPDSLELTVAFVDLVRFTSLTDVHGDRIALDAAMTLESIAHESLAGSVEIVKTLGDGVLLVAPDPLSGLRCASAIVERLHEAGTGADARAGLHHGPVIRRHDDVFGATVNLASRLVPLADRGTIVVTRPIAMIADELSLPVVPLGSRPLRGLVEDVEIFRVNPCRHSGPSLADPVCGMRLEAGSVVGAATLNDRDVGFCSERCAELFRENPARFRVGPIPCSLDLLRGLFGSVAEAVQLDGASRDVDNFASGLLIDPGRLESAHVP